MNVDNLLDIIGDISGLKYNISRSIEDSNSLIQGKGVMSTLGAVLIPASVFVFTRYLSTGGLDRDRENGELAALLIAVPEATRLADSMGLVENGVPRPDHSSGEEYGELISPTTPTRGVSRDRPNISTTSRKPTI